MRSGGWRFCREPSGFDLAYKNGMTSTFATQFISGSPKAMCEHREEKVSCKRLMGDKKGLQRKEKYVVKLSSLLAVHLCRVECGNPLKNQFSLVY